MLTTTATPSTTLIKISPASLATQTLQALLVHCAELAAHACRPPLRHAASSVAALPPVAGLHQHRQLMLSAFI